MSTYTTATAAARLAGIGISASTVRNYSNHPAVTPLLSPEAHPGPGKTRRFSDDDLQVITSIYQQVQAGASLEDAAAQAHAGIVLEAPAGNSPQLPASAHVGHVEPPGATQEPDAIGTSATPPGAALVLRSVYEAMNAQHEELWARVVELERENARLQAELATARKPSLWQRLFARKPATPEP